MSSQNPTIIIPNGAQTVVRSSPGRLDFDDSGHPAITLPPPLSTVRLHQRSKTVVEIPPLQSRCPSPSPTRSSTFLPFRKSSRAISPDNSSSTSLHNSARSVDIPAKAKTSNVARLSSWFEGSSEPVNISLVPSPKKEMAEPFYKMESVREAVAGSQPKLTQRPAKRHTASPSTANSSMFSFFKRASQFQQPKAEPDDLLQMDIAEALLPEGPLDDYSPETFESLRHTAEALVKKFQLSHAETLGALRQMTSERNVQADELEASQTRNEHLKFQLLEMAERAAEQEKLISKMQDQLHKHQQGIRMVSEDEPHTPRRPYRRNRHSDCSSSGDSLADSEMSSVVSIFSDVESIRTPATSVAASPVMKHARLCSPAVTPNFAPRSHTTPVFTSDCSNCHGVPASEAWDVIGIMKMESMGLKQRVVELETAQDAALDFLSGLSL